MSSGITHDDLIRRDRAIVAASAAALVLLSWLIMIQGHASTGSAAHALHGAMGPATHRLDAASFALAFSMWMVMMVAMMVPTVLPWILLFAASSRNTDPSAPPYVSSALFTSGYLVAWALYSLPAAAAQLALQRLALLHGGELRTAPAVSGILLAAAGLFQLTPLKWACLRHCRSPLGFFLTRWRRGPWGAVRMGFRHGLYCVACCWALMVLSFALGVMNLVWMAALTLMLCVEKILPGGRLASRLFGVFLTAWGAWLLLS